MPQPKPAPTTGPIPISTAQNHKGLYLVDRTQQRELPAIARQSRSLGLLALAAAALAAPLMWIAHALLHALHIR